MIKRRSRPGTRFWVFDYFAKWSHVTFSEIWPCCVPWTKIPPNLWLARWNLVMFPTTLFISLWISFVLMAYLFVGPWDDTLVWSIATRQFLGLTEHHWYASVYQCGPLSNDSSLSTHFSKRHIRSSHHRLTQQTKHRVLSQTCSYQASGMFACGIYVICLLTSVLTVFS